MHKSIFLFISLFLIHAAHAAQDPDLQQSIQISGDFLQMNVHTASGSYQGNFVATQGSMRLTGNKVQVNQDKNKQLVSIIASGNPVKFSKKIATTQETIQATASQITYQAQQNKITLEGNAALTSDAGKQIKAGKISYDLNTGNFQAERSGTQRVHIQFQPAPASH